nr:MGMT family protein [uncultured Methanoregula sp.]
MNPTNTVLKETEFSTQFGSVRLIWTEPASGLKVERIILPGDTRAEDGKFPPATSVKSVDNELVSSLVDGIRSFLSGEDVVFGTEILDLDRCRPFQRQVLLAEHGIPRGKVSTYGRIARHLGIPGSARAVGNALARNPFPLVIPCHRALRSDGDPGGFQGGQEMKVRLLAMEGARFRPNGKVLMEHVWY